MIGCIFGGLTPRARHPEIVPVVRAAIFEGKNVLDNPIVCRPKLALALTTPAASVDKKLGDLLRT
jgi:hypothetical protein